MAHHPSARGLLYGQQVGAGRCARVAGPVRNMRELEAVWKLARADLVISTDDGGTDVFLWEHSVRVAKSAQYLSRLPEAQARKPDPVALLTAALYHEAGWLARLREGEIHRFEILFGVSPESIAIDSIRVMQHTLQSVISAESLSVACDALRGRTGIIPESIEGQVLSDADNLEEFGLGFLWTTIRRGICGGRGVRAVLDAWKRRTEYQFWNARLKDSFRFDASRKLAQTRLAQLEVFMLETERQHEVEDVRNIVDSVLEQASSPLKWPMETDVRPWVKG